MPTLPQASPSFWSKVDRRDGDACWEWRGYRNRAGYGCWHPAAGVNVLAHRVAFTDAKGEIPEGLVLDHLCRVRHCVNPAHLEPVSIGENVLRGDTLPARRLASTTCPNGHDYGSTPPTRRGARECRTCKNEANRRWYANKKRQVA